MVEHTELIVLHILGRCFLNNNIPFFPTQHDTRRAQKNTVSVNMLVTGKNGLLHHCQEMGGGVMEESSLCVCGWTLCPLGKLFST